MGTNGVTRGQLRPHFTGRSPPFLVAALCVGLGILGVSYWSLCSQYNDLEEELKKVLQNKQSLENDHNLLQSQLNSRENEFNKVQMSAQKKEQELTQSNNLLKAKTDDINANNAKIDSLIQSNNKCNEDLSKKENELGDALTKLKDTDKLNDQFRDEQNKLIDGLKLENQHLKAELDSVKKQSVNDNKINNNSSNSGSTSQDSVVGQQVIASPLNKVENGSELKPDLTVKETLKSQAEPPDAENMVNQETIAQNDLSLKQEAVAGDPNAGQLPELAEDDKKVDAIVPVEGDNDIDDRVDQNKDIAKEEPKYV